jgi:hypothetical protein
LPFLQTGRGWSGVRPDDGRKATRTDFEHRGRDGLMWWSGDQATGLAHRGLGSINGARWERAGVTCPERENRSVARHHFGFHRKCKLPTCNFAAGDAQDIPRPRGGYLASLGIWPSPGGTPPPAFASSTGPGGHQRSARSPPADGSWQDLKQPPWPSGLRRRTSNPFFAGSNPAGGASWPRFPIRTALV